MTRVFGAVTPWIAVPLSRVVILMLALLHDDGRDSCSPTWIAKNDRGSDVCGSADRELLGSIVNELAALRVTRHDNLRIGTPSHGFRDERRPVRI